MSCQLPPPTVLLHPNLPAPLVSLALAWPALASLARPPAPGRPGMVKINVVEVGKDGLHLPHRKWRLGYRMWP